ncbi:MAG: LuxR C-terminal-related transcriptional regulator [Saprospiraceae bacterium]
MKAKQKQGLLIALSIFLALCSIGFSFNGTSFLWFWQKNPIIPIILLCLVFLVVRYWLKLEIDAHRQHILAEYERSLSQNEQADFKKLLSLREIEVLELINNGLSNKEIANRLFISLSTVKTHINNIYKILDIKNRREAIEKTNVQIKL